MSSDRTFELPGLHVREITLDVPLDRAQPQRASIEVFARVVTAHGGADRPYAMYLQGGPGVEAPRPSLEPASPGWLPRVLDDYQLILLDQRGTGRSTPAGLDTAAPGLPSARTLRAAAPSAAAEYLTHFRADAIVEDALAVLRHLGADTVTPIGQSFGGFTTVHWMSTRPETLAGAIITGGLPAVGRAPEEVYAATWAIMRRKSLSFYQRFPGDRNRMESLMARAADGEILLPSGAPVTPARLRTLGHRLGATGGAEQLHWLLWLDPASPAFRHDLADALPYGSRNPLYAVIHESCIADGTATRWAAERAMPDDVRADPTLLGGEHTHPGLFDEDPELRHWKQIADELATHEWPALYDRETLAQVNIPAAAIVYFDDGFVPTPFSLETADLIPSMTPWVTNEWEHNGIRASGTEVIDRLIGMVKGRRLT